MAEIRTPDAPLVSVTVTTYNRASLVTASIDSVLAQTYPHFEVIVVDDGSTDDTPRVIQDRYGSRVRYLRQENQGPAGARNTAIRASRGKYIAFHDDDDMWLPRKLERQVEALERHPECALSYCACLEATPEGENTGRVYGDSGRGRSGDIFALFLRRCVILEPAAIIRASVLEQVGLFDAELPAGKDTDFFLRVLMQYPAVYVREPLALIREHPQRKTLSDRRRGRTFQAQERTMLKLLDMLPLERARERPLVVRRLLAAKLGLLELRAGELAWQDFAGELVEVARALQDTAGEHHLCQAAAGAVKHWAHAERAQPVAPPSPQQLAALVEALAAAGAATSGRVRSRAAYLYAALALSGPGEGTFGGLSWLGRAARRSLPAAVAHCAWAVAQRLMSGG